MAASNLQELLDESGNVVDLLRNSRISRFIFPVVPSEFTNWIRESEAARTTAVLFDQTHHMVNLFLRGPGALQLLAETGVNGMGTFAVDSAKQFVCVAPGGGVIGDGILFRLADDEFIFVGRAPVANWLTFRGETAGYNVEISVDPRSPARPYGKAVRRALWRFQIQGPNAWPIIEKINGAPVEQVRFFRLGFLDVAGEKVRTLRHGMAGAAGLELWGDYESYDKIRDAILEAGHEFGLEPCGSRAYPVATLESGWIPSPLPAVYSDDALRSYRQSLPADGYEATNSLAGSFVSPEIEDYYLNPWELGYGNFVKFDHDFIGRDALHALVPDVQRRKVTLAWNAEDVAELLASPARGAGPRYQFLDLPLATTGTSSFDSVLDAADKVVGLSMFTGYSANERQVISLAVIDSDVPIGAEVSVIWGEPDITEKVTIEPHEQFTVRAIVSPAPYSPVARETYRDGWRTATA
ncbi:glycine cleavage system protein T [Mycobacterium paraense]|uniref:Glycine cleavage system protein T n=1 Tax=Mycobacterium paraense TaxID=767916 RepID=A0ABX3VR95_9MYCO|nr:aminomethyltransferase family protein [Mycobacterium paraense]ORW32738.1 glycine cleavage system protein T [Mycobacterium paraense]ORW44963.1 glycine cleavage system protein T [Mycobacterium paraense]